MEEEDRKKEKGDPYSRLHYEGSRCSEITPDCPYPLKLIKTRATPGL
jgi:hypothetical protein